MEEQNVILDISPSSTFYDPFPSPMSSHPLLSSLSFPHAHLTPYHPHRRQPDPQAAFNHRLFGSYIMAETLGDGNYMLE